jgi:ankyrin repeat protein
LFPQERAAAAAAAAGVDTHTGSIHNSVDQSFTRLAKLYDSENVREIEGSSRSVEVTRDAAWDAKIGRGLEDFRREIEGVIKDEESLESFLKPTLAKGEDPTEPKAKFKYHAETAVRLLDGLDKEIFGNVYTIRPKEPVSCGLTPREIVAIAYSSLSDRAQWENSHLKEGHFMSLVENMYKSNRGYNIDSHGDGEYKTHGADQDNNKCVGGMINQIAEGLKDHKKVTIKVLDVSSMKGPMVSGALAGALRNIVAEEGATSLREDISKWCVGGEVSQALVDEIVNELKNNLEFSEEFGDDGIVRFSPQVMRALSKEELSEIGKEVFGTKDLGVLEDRLDKFVFDEKEGYISSAEFLYKKDKEKYIEVLQGDLKSCFVPIEYGDGYREGAELMNFLMSSPNKGFLDVTMESIIGHFRDLQKESCDYQLILAAERNHVSIFKWMLESSLVDVNIKNPRDETVLHIATKRGHGAILERVLASGQCSETTLVAQDRNGQTALMYASSVGEADMVKAMLASYHCTENTLSAQDKYGNGVLHGAVQNGQTDTVKEILSNDKFSETVLNAKNVEGQAAMYDAVSENQEEIVKAILASKQCSESTLKYVDEYNNTALHRAIYDREGRIFKAILRSIHCTEDVLKSPNLSGNTSLHKAADVGNKGMVEEVLASKECGKDVLNAKNPDGNSALMLASRSGHNGVVRAMLESPLCTLETLSFQNEQGDTALMMAILEGEEKIAEMILDHPNGSDMLDARNIDGKTALDLAKDRGLVGLEAKIIVKTTMEGAAKSEGKRGSPSEKAKQKKGGGQTR